MKLIAYGGITSKNVPNSSRDAFLLALHNHDIQGIAVDVYLTQDEKVVICNQPFLNQISNGHGKIKDHTLKHLQRINLGNKVKRQDIITLEELLSLLQNSTKLCIIHITDEKNPERNKKLMDQVILYIQKYPNANLYIKSHNLDMILYLRKQNIKSKVGLCVNQKNCINELPTLDFYSIQYPDLSTFTKNILSNQQLILVEHVSSQEQLPRIDHGLETITTNIFVITHQNYPFMNSSLNRCSSI